ncbi:hypothetical protein KQI42_09415 [Tissierella sp. MSJ-40]|uniref:Uncharacterized protein n=1 Tax=Tissierella simiarum TaxID=2841534 RepID=A0ABS6E5P2_9FIRM|nr:hypothetical protein [Tissierella simiarum]MBU5438227.1 hypothetical protein [Tissierella simiarum]
MVCKINLKRAIIIFMALLLVVVGFIWYKEQKTNKEVPKKAKFVETIIERGDYYS